MLKPILPFFAAAVFGLMLTPAWGQTPQQPAPAQTPAATAAPAAKPPKGLGPMPADMKNPIKPTADSQARAKQIYQYDCSMCHGDNGNGKSDLATSMSLTLSDWTNPKTLADKTDGELFDIIRSGTGDQKMPPEDAARAKDDVIWNLVIYIRGFAKAAPSAASAAN